MRRLCHLTLVLLCVSHGASALTPVAQPEPSQEITLNDAANSDDLQVEVSAGDDSGHSVTISVTRDESDEEVIVVIPLCTIIWPAKKGAQRLMVASDTRLVLAAGQSFESVDVSTFCIDEFAPPPPISAPMALAAPDPSVEIRVEEREPLHKLAECLTDEDASDGDKQLAVWAVSGKMLGRSRTQALSALTEGLTRQMLVERRRQLEAKRGDARKLAPDLSEAQLDQIFEAEIKDGMDDLRKVAADKASEQLDSFVTHDKDLMARCGWDASQQRIFQ